MYGVTEVITWKATFLLWLPRGPTQTADAGSRAETTLYVYFLVACNGRCANNEIHCVGDNTSTTELNEL